MSGPLFNEVGGWMRLVTLLKIASTTIVFLSILQIFSEHLFCLRSGEGYIMIN